MDIEFEAKFIEVNVERLRNRLVSLGALNTKKKHLLRRKVFDFPQATEYKQWIRVRDEDGPITITLKRVLDGAKIDGTHEIELNVNDFEKACEFFEALGFIPGPYQENYRESWSLNSCLITIDTWPGLKPFVEIEADNEKTVRLIARSLGFDFEKAYFGPVDAVYEQELGITKEDFNSISKLTFDAIDSVLAKI